VKPLILITNDDGVRSPGLHALAEAAAVLGDVLIAAPIHQQTAMSRATHFGEGAGRIEMLDIPLNGQPQRAYGVYGSPAMSAAHGILELAPRLPDLCLSGINYGENIGYSLSRSGTIGAAIEAASHGIPGIAVSLESSFDAHFSNDYQPMAWETAAWIAGRLAARVLEHGLPAGTHVLNINVPSGATHATPVRWTHVSRHNYYAPIVQPTRDFDQPFRLRVVQDAPEDSEPDSDVRAFAIDRVISISPLTGDMTARGWQAGDFLAQL
jgi:5'-nucleotidase